MSNTPPASGSMRITVPAKKRPRAQHFLKVPPAGTHVGTVTALTKPEDMYEIGWSFRAAHPGERARTWKLTQEVDAAGLADILVDLGFAGQDVTDEQVVGASCRLKVVTMGGQAWARVKDTLPLAA